MTDTELLNKIKTGLGITGDYHNDILQIYIDSVKDFMRDKGCAEAVINSTVSVGAILAGVNDLYNYSSGDIKFSDFTIKRILQLAHKTPELVQIMSINICIPDLENAAVFGWTVTNVLQKNTFVKNINSCEFDLTDSQILKATILMPDGSVITGEENGTGNRRRVKVGTNYIGVYNNTIYDSTISKYVSADGITCISVPEEYTNAEITLEAYEKVNE